MPTGLEQINQVARHGIVVQGDEDTGLARGPPQHVRMQASQWEVIEIAHGDHIDGLHGDCIMTSDGAPEHAPRVLVE
jgi:hypothetical protein